VAETLANKRCRECGASILVAITTPHPLADQATGMPASRWDGDREREYHVGWICQRCAFDLAAQAGAGHGLSGPDWEFHYGHRPDLA
jgi:hypothetical protein